MKATSKCLKALIGKVLGVNHVAVRVRSHWFLRLAPLFALLACAPSRPPAAVDPDISLRDLAIVQATVAWFSKGDSSNVPFVMLDHSDSTWAAGGGEALHAVSEPRAWPFVPGFVAANTASRKLPCEWLQPVRRPIVCVRTEAFVQAPYPNWNAVQSVVPGATEVWSLSWPGVDPTGQWAYMVLNRHCAAGRESTCERPVTLELCYADACLKGAPAAKRELRWYAWRIQFLPADPDL